MGDSPITDRSLGHNKWLAVVKPMHNVNVVPDPTPNTAILDLVDHYEHLFNPPVIVA